MTQPKTILQDRRGRSPRLGVCPLCKDRNVLAPRGGNMGIPAHVWMRRGKSSGCGVWPFCKDGNVLAPRGGNMGIPAHVRHPSWRTLT